MTSRLKRLVVAAGMYGGLAAWLTLGAGCELNSDVKETRYGGGPDGVPPLTIEPVSWVFNASQTSKTFQAVGGEAPYQWSVANTNRGVVAADGARAVYTRIGVGGNVLTVRDAGGQKASATIEQR